MRTAIGLVALPVVLLLGCASDVDPISTGTLSGTVVAAPCRPVERASDPPCPPVAGVVVEIGNVRAVTDASGVYRVTLPPGTYAVAVTSGTRRVAAEPSAVTVRSGQAATVNLTFDSGIR